MLALTGLGCSPGDVVAIPPVFEVHICELQGYSCSLKSLFLQKIKNHSISAKPCARDVISI